MRLWMLVLVLMVAGCAGGGGTSDGPDVAGDVSVDSGNDDVGTELRAGETKDEDAVVEWPTTRRYTYRAIGGVSMGATAFSLHARRPGSFDMVAALGGYINPPYQQSMMKRYLFGGFCPLETILAHLDEINDPESQALSCGVAAPVSPWEFPVDFNHWKADISGGTWDRSFYFTAIQGLFLSLGNYMSYNPEHPWLPPGVPVSWAAPGPGAERCEAPVTIGKPWNYNLEYNPDGEYDLVTFCDGSVPIPGGKDNPDWFELAGLYDPTWSHDTPVYVLTAVDLNGNGRRDYHEPVLVHNNMERFEDVGADGCGDADEDGLGGCGGGGEGEDPNGDNQMIPDNPAGTEGDGWRQEGEAWADDGLDGVPGTEDFGEGDGEFTINPNLVTAMELTPWRWIDEAPVEELAAVDILLDGGIRDALDAAVGFYQIAVRLQARGVDMAFFDNYTGSTGALFPSVEPTDLMTHVAEVDFSPEAIGKNYMIAYGKPGATEEEIAQGDGKHVGTGTQVVNRLAGYILTALMRWPDLPMESCVGDMGKTIAGSFYSPSMENRCLFAYSTPPCYEKAGYEDQAYPLILLLAGVGSAPSEGMATATFFNLMVMNGLAPGFVMAIPDTSCCLRDMETGLRYCACTKSDDDSSLNSCVDPSCTGPEAGCDVTLIPRAQMEEECFGGHFYGNLHADRWGDTEAAAVMRYEDMIYDLQEYMETNFRLLDPVEVDLL